ncbi:hypothetical protein [Streptococcus uberis]|uniref:hypothetical protein n=1 Tax=Streptococcus uberis TaxID=1349 RepID=UPI001FF6D2FA|nr:hypothetical protein [Streptococcus uberis]MCK1228251.1 hypothetical protein [Streptococcus uberis]
MEILRISDNVAVYSDGSRLQVIHNLGDEFVMDLEVVESPIIRLETSEVVGIDKEVRSSFSVSGFCSRGIKGLDRLKIAILNNQFLIDYVKENQLKLLELISCNEVENASN